MGLIKIAFRESVVYLYILDYPINMSKRDLKKYLAALTKEQTDEQLLELYSKFADVKVYYDFVFNPNEEKLSREAKAKISNEYFPIKGRRPKMRRSIAQKIIKHFLSLGVDAFVIADVMLYNIEIAQEYSSKREIRQPIFYKSMYNSFTQVISFLIEKGILTDFINRVEVISTQAISQKWENSYAFSDTIERLQF